MSRHSSKIKKHGLKEALEKIFNFLNKNPWIIFAVILLIGMSLRYYQIENTVNFGWDQARDSWVVSDILKGKFTLVGPRTGIGHFNLGPLHFYLLAPFFALTKFDPVALHYLNFILNILNFVIIFFVAKKILNNYSALFISLIYATNSYVVFSNQIPWNVTFMPGISFLIFYSIYKIYKNKFNWIFILATLLGIYFHIHFTAIFVVLISILSLIFVKNRTKTLKYGLLSLPLFLIWFVPNIIYELQNSGQNIFRIRDFLNDYSHGLHLRFLIYRIPDSVIQFIKILNFPNLSVLRFIIPAIFALLILKERANRENLLLGYLISLWFIVPLIGFTLYSGPISDYYFFYQVPFVLMIITYILTRAIKLYFPKILILFAVFWSIYVLNNLQTIINIPRDRGLSSQKEQLKQDVEEGLVLPYEEGSIRSYLYEFLTDKHEQ